MWDAITQFQHFQIANEAAGSVLWNSPHSTKRGLNVAFQYHMRTFTFGGLSSSDPVRNTEGISLERATGYLKRINEERETFRLVEKRISCQLVTTVNLEWPVYKMVFLSDYMATWKYVENMNPSTRFDWSESKPPLQFCMWYGGIATFQEFLSSTLDNERASWNTLLQFIDISLGVEVSVSLADLQFIWTNPFSLQLSDIMNP